MLAPDQVIVPAFSRVRELKKTVSGLGKLSAAPGAITGGGIERRQRHLVGRRGFGLPVAQVNDLGYAIVKSLVGLHAGEISVQSRIDEGTTVTVALPLAFSPRALTPSSNIATLAPALRSATQDQAYQVKRSA